MVSILEIDKDLIEKEIAALARKLNEILDDAYEKDPAIMPYQMEQYPLILEINERIDRLIDML